MTAFVDKYWQVKFERLGENLKKNNFDPVIVESAAAAGQYVLDHIVPDHTPGSVAFGGSMTLASCGILDKLTEVDGVNLIAPNAPNISAE